MPVIAKNGNFYGENPNYNNITDTSGIISTLKPDYSKSVSHIGMIIHSTTLDTEEKVKSIYGGKTWVKIEGRVLLGTSNSHTVNSVGGSETHAITVAEMPSHTHGLNNHTHSLNGHTHSIPALSGSTGNPTDGSSLASHVHGTLVDKSSNGGGRSDWGLTAAGAFGGNVLLARGVGGTNTSLPTQGPDYIAHGHSVTTVANTTGGNSGNTGAASGNTAANGSGNSMSIMMPYKTVYIWERTA